jgi:ABC-type transporter Mla subunit MlaD
MIATTVAEIDTLRAELDRAKGDIAAFAYLLEDANAELAATRRKLDQTIGDLARMTARAYSEPSR